jgi:dolichol-phosphate mannosyltransferase
MSADSEDRIGFRPLVVIPTYNEAGNIVAMAGAVMAIVPSASLLVVDDGSPDGTADLVEQAAVTFDAGRVRVLRRQSKMGLGTAYREGFAWGIEQGHDVLVQMDADFQHDPAALPSLLLAVADGADTAIGSRYVSGGSVPATWPRSRKALSRLGNWYARTLLGLPVRDVTAGFRAHRASILSRIDLSSIEADGYGFQIGLTDRVARAGGKQVEVPIQFGQRTAGTSKMSLRIVMEALWLVTRRRISGDRSPRA